MAYQSPSLSYFLRADGQIFPIPLMNAAKHICDSSRTRIITPPVGAIRQRDIASEAFQDAIQYLEKGFAGNTAALSWLKTVESTSLDDLLETTRYVEDKYDRSSRNRPGLISWLRGLSTRVMYYGRVLDTLAQHHPEYVSLVWGVVKFVLMGIINHGNLVVQFSQALSMISHVLPITKLSAELYQTDQMKDAVANLYAHILLFLKQVVRWYVVGPAGRALTALFKPYELSYKDTVEQIRLCANAIDDIANIAVKAEVREMNVFLHEQSERLAERETKLHDMQAKFEVAQVDMSTTVGRILQIVTASSCQIGDIQLDLRDMKPRVTDIHFKQMLDVLEPKRSPEDTLRGHQSLIRRSPPWKRRSANMVRVLQSVTRWITSPTSAVLVLKAQARAQARVKEIATEIIALLRPQATKLVWYLSSISSDADGTVDTSDLLRSLVFQSMKLASNLVSSNPELFSVEKLSASHNPQEWVELLCWILRRLTESFVIVEAEDVIRNSGHSSQFAQTFQWLARHLNDGETRIKLLVVSYGTIWPLDMEGDDALGEVVEVWRETPVPRRMRRGSSRMFSYRSILS
ncbi:hypothetical protein F5Y09DRAFT_307743 [Xylaria sp. FL1042]|nr:hypothetical protein F5Y09DRAFT_307743 [Xylaria sp. FL1042]